MPILNKIYKRKQSIGEIKRRESNKRDNLNHKYVYNTSQWKALRIEFLRTNPLCNECLKKTPPIYISAVEVHHITPISSTNNILKKQQLGFDYNNLKGLCEQCHKNEHKKRQYF